MLCCAVRVLGGQPKQNQKPKPTKNNKKQQHKLPLRITEANSISDAGLHGVSDVFASALWTTDLAFEFAAAGAASVHLHWGIGGGPDGTKSTPSYTAVRTAFNATHDKDAFPGGSFPVPQVCTLCCAVVSCVVL